MAPCVLPVKPGLGPHAEFLLMHGLKPCESPARRVELQSVYLRHECQHRATWQLLQAVLRRCAIAGSLLAEPGCRLLANLLERIDRSLFSDDAPTPLPLAGRKLQVNSDWGRDTP